MGSASLVDSGSGRTSSEEKGSAVQEQLRSQITVRVVAKGGIRDGCSWPVGPSVQPFL